jgi:ABC-type uncharacterized transport system substrate-binding protein
VEVKYRPTDVEVKMKKIIIAVALFLAVSLQAHPHVFIDYSLSFIFDNSRFQGIQVVWFFDDMYSSNIISDFDKNGSRVFEEEEVEDLRKNAFSNLSQFNYFFDLSINRKIISVKEIRNFSVAIYKNRLVYSFFIPLSKRSSHLKSLDVAVIDPTFFCATTLMKTNGVSVRGLEEKQYTFKIYKKPKDFQMYGTIDQTFVNFKIR